LILDESGMEAEIFELPVSGRLLRGALHYVSEAAPVVITCHGLFSSKHSDKFLQIASSYTAAGFNVVRFDFGGCGESTGDIADTTVTNRLQDLDAVHCFSACRLTGPVGILGSSFGGYVGLLHAAEHPVAALSVWSTPKDLLSISHTIPQADLQKLKSSFFEDARRYELQGSIGGLRPVQVIHGSADEIVPLEQAREIHEVLGEPREYIVLPGADHSITQTPSRTEALARSLAWFKTQLLRSY
jgi:pimeloyl-ACP methyl ester carboxylesterase